MTSRCSAFSAPAQGTKKGPSAAELAELNALRLATRNLPEPTVARLLDAIEWHLASQLARGAKQDYALAVALALGNTRHANLDPHVCERVAQLQYQLAQQLAQEP